MLCRCNSCGGNKEMKELSVSLIPVEESRIQRGNRVIDNKEVASEPRKAGILSPESIAERIGGISVKSLTELIRKSGLETTTLGYTEPSRRGGPPRRIWGMTEQQLLALLNFRESRARARSRG